MKYFPFFLQLKKLPCLVVGGGSVAERKLDLLIKADADITVISLDFTDYILELSKIHDIKCITDEYSEKLLEGNNTDLLYLRQMMFLSMSKLLKTAPNTILLSMLSINLRYVILFFHLYLREATLQLLYRQVEHLLF